MLKFNLAKIISVFVLTTSLLIAPKVRAYYYDSIDKVGFHGYDGEGDFVENSAYVGSSLGYVIFISPPFFPAQALTEPTRLIYDNKFQNFSDTLGKYILMAPAKTFGAIFGAPAYGVKKAFWDIPGYIVNGKWPNNSIKPKEITINPKLLNEGEKASATETLAVKSQTTPIVEQGIKKQELVSTKPQAVSEKAKPQIQKPGDEIRKHIVQPSQQKEQPSAPPAQKEQPAYWTAPSISGLLTKSTLDTTSD